ncbi:MAG: hypothetical protein ACREBW_04120 [Candidatus Micrarchaeaceae archaeon]
MKRPALIIIAVVVVLIAVSFAYLHSARGSNTTAQQPPHYQPQ